MAGPGRIWIGGTRRSPQVATYVAPGGDLVPPAVQDLAAVINCDDVRVPSGPSRHGGVPDTGGLPGSA